MQKNGLSVQKLGIFAQRVINGTVTQNVEPGSQATAVMVAEGGYADVTVIKNEPMQCQITFDGRFGLPEKYVGFTKRADLLDQLDASSSTDPRADNSKFIITGTGGIGKTQLAIISTHKQLRLYQKTRGETGCRSVIWFIAGTDEGVDNTGLMTEQFQRLGEQLGFDTKALQLDELIRQVYQRLGEKHGPYSVVFDNAQDYVNIVRYLPPTPARVIVTTRNSEERDWELSFRMISVGVFSEKEALNYIKKFLDRNRPLLYNEADAKELAKALGFFPLALTQALAFISTENIPIEIYLVEFRQKLEQYLQKPVPKGDHYQGDKNPTHTNYGHRPKEAYDSQKATVWAVIQLSLKKITNPNANQILKACAYLAPEAPIAMNLLSHCTANIEEYHKAVAALRHYSLLENATLPHHVRIHQLVQEILKLGDNEEDKSIFLGWMVDFLRGYYEKQNDPINDERRRKILLPHLQVILEHFERMPQEFTGEFEEINADLHLYVGNIYLNSGDPVLAERNLSSAQKFFESSGNLIQLARINVNRSAACLRLGKPAEAIKRLEGALPFLQEVCSPNDYELGLLLGNLGNAYLDLGRVSDAKDLLELSCRIIEHNFEKNHHEVAKAWVNLGMVYLECFRTEDAKFYLIKALSILKGTYGEHPIVATALFNLARADLELGEVEKAKKSAKEAYDILEREPKQNKFALVRVLSTLAVIFLKLDNPDDAKTHCERSLAIIRSMVDQNHQEVARITGLLGEIYRHLGNIVLAKQHLEETLPLLDHMPTKVAIHRVNLAFVLSELGQQSAALAQLQKSYEVFDDKDPNKILASELILKLQSIRMLLPVRISPTLESSWKFEEFIQSLTCLQELNTIHIETLAISFYSELGLIYEPLELLSLIPKNKVSLAGVFLTACCQLESYKFDECFETISLYNFLAERDNQNGDIKNLEKRLDNKIKLKKQREIVLKALEEQTDLSIIDQINRVEMLYTLRRYDEALQVINNIISNNPPLEFLALAYFNQARCFFAFQLYEDAQVSCNTIIRLKDDPRVKALKEIIERVISVRLLVWDLVLLYRPDSLSTNAF